jgi:hypothetical protein
MAFSWDGADLSRSCRSRRYAKLNIANEGLDSASTEYQTYQDFLNDQDASARYDRAVYVATTPNQDIAITETAYANYN